MIDNRLNKRAGSAATVSIPSFDPARVFGGPSRTCEFPTNAPMVHKAQMETSAGGDLEYDGQTKRIFFEKPNTI